MTLEEFYLKRKNIHERFEALRETDADGKLALRQAYSNVVDKLYAEETPTAIGIFEDYAESRMCGNKRLNLRYAPCPKDVPAFAETLHKLGVEKFTMSAASTNALEVALALNQNGYRCDGITQVNGMEEFFSDEPEQLPALVFTAIPIYWMGR